MWKKNQDEPVVLTLSSDEEDSGESNPIKISTTNQTANLESISTVYEPLNPKEPIIEPNSSYEEWQLQHQNFKGWKVGSQDLEDSKVFVSLQCRSVRIGSYKVVPNEKLCLSPKGITAIVPPFIEGEAKAVHLMFPVGGIRKILAHFGSSIPVFFIYVTDPLAKTIRQNLQMIDENGFYFDPCSHEESQKRLTILPEKMQSETVQLIKNMFKFMIYNEKNRNIEPMQFLEELSQKDANEILVRSSPVEIESLAVNSRAVVTYETRTLLVFPPPPNKGGITVTMDDYCCLMEEQFLNDVLVDFFLKWLHMCNISEADRERTHVFSTFFYKRLTAKPKNKFRPSFSEIDPTLSPAERRHARVQSWTKNVDIFSKDFILIPINEQSHWFLAVICFPYLDGPIHASTGKLVPVSEATLPTRSSSRRKRKIEIPVIDECDESDRDEAEGDDFELEDDDDMDDQSDSNIKQKKSKDDAIKQPCILILDSLSGSSRSRIVSTLRDYLTVEYSNRKEKSKIFNKDTMMGACPKVPQQTNFSDCGIFILQYAQSFFENPIKDFRLPIRIPTWFSQDVAAAKRESVALLIKLLMDEHKPNHGISLPSVHPNADGNEDKLPEAQPQIQSEQSVTDEEEKSIVYDTNIDSFRISSDPSQDASIDSGVTLPNNSNDQTTSNNTSKTLNNSINSSCDSSVSHTTVIKVARKLDNDRTAKLSVPLKSSLENTNNKESNSKYSQLRNSRVSSPKVNKPVNNALQLVCDSYSNDTEDEDNISDMEEDAIFISSKTKRFKISPTVES